MFRLTAAEVKSAGVEVRPPDVHATVLKAMGLGSGHISNQEPKIIEAMLKS